MNQNDKLVMMANQIAQFFAAQGEVRAVPQIAAHINSFWAPRMRAHIRSHLASGGAGLSTLARSAVATLQVTTEVSAVAATDGSDAG
jgi:formate dehydrogenase subunit delta